MFKKYVKNILPKNILVLVTNMKNKYFNGYYTKSYSQEGEDLILRRLFGGQKSGFYVDVGAHHPKRFSNTYLFYLAGWNGINIDAMPGSMKIFNKIRPRDINIEKPVSEKKEVLTYYAFNDPALNGFSKKLSDERKNNKNDYHVVFEKDIETSTLTKILSTNLPKDQKIDFLSIDVEGLDFMVLKSNDFNIFKPKVILIEILGSTLNDIEDNEITNFLKDQEYQVYAKAINTVIFISNKFFNDTIKKKYN